MKNGATCFGTMRYKHLSCSAALVENRSRERDPSAAIRGHEQRIVAPEIRHPSAGDERHDEKERRPRTQRLAGRAIVSAVGEVVQHAHVCRFRGERDDQYDRIAPGREHRRPPQPKRAVERRQRRSDLVLPPFPRGESDGVALARHEQYRGHRREEVRTRRVAQHARETAGLQAERRQRVQRGVRNMFWHQLRDREADAGTNVRTFVVRRGVAAATRLVTHVAFPLQLCALAVMLWRLRSVWPVAALALYALLMARRPYRWGVRARIVAAGPRSFVVLNEYDEGYFPAAILFASALLHRADFIVLAMHLALFPRHTLQSVREVGGLLLPRRHPRDPA